MTSKKKTAAVEVATVPFVHDALAIRTVNRDDRAYDNFLWPNEIGAVVEIVRDQAQAAVHARCLGSHQIVALPTHHADIPPRATRGGKARLSLTQCAPEVEVRSLSVYEALLSVEVAA